MDIKPRAPLPPDARTLPARYYTDPEVFHSEMERLFFRMWVCAGRTEQIANPGSYVGRELAGESIILTRDTERRVRAFYNVCRHRGTRLCGEPHGAFPGMIQCPYHAWTYALDGSLVAAPHMDEALGFKRENYSLHSVASDEWDGHIFINLARDLALGSHSTLRDQLASLPAKFRPWRMEDLRLAKRIVYDVRSNWKLLILNYSECLHCPVIHPALNGLSYYLSGENEPFAPTYMGGRMVLRDGVETMSTDGKRRRTCLPHVSDEDRRRVYYYAIFPNLLLTLHPDYVMTHTIWPRACDRTEVICEWHFHPDQMATPEFNPEDVVEFWDLTNRQDWHVSERLQLGISSRAYEPGPYSDREDLLYAFERYIERVLE